MPAPDHSMPSDTIQDSTASLPPGMVLGPDGKPCRTCTDWKSWSKIGKKAKTTAADGRDSSSSSTSTFDYEAECPPDKEVLGRATWTFLHTMAAYYPDKPNAQEQSTMKSLLSSFSQFYPCGYCAEHLREEMKVDPPKVESRMELAWWMCGMHNKVNEMLGKEIFDCNKLDERWRDGPADGRCD
ncbi:ERV/ALR sulfhydryl oxidase domain-containing protein [Lobosporangium transversale]|uniref:Sulfhydryl oxidase n=1 Tax=Lobosporangium transversale TaxID=64571 RepID=A0A1Y2GB58_9FUNG|nr:ERV/ALR sulfhydryl oxidase domain-containing protein [Lobosporangium transversale]ORY99620.1 ERV/ALR sulfhydryl oxidase domain-containing protein [Lobosporangium transversale]|eukprot:XP_021875915.1 ERV/ALR sulfhydryl oxidase domain-containing protein [Lobosporangium transversale]